jgi:putative phosphoribosyl transferase
MQPLFRDREDAGRRLAAALAELRTESPLVLGIPRGGVVVGSQIACELDAELDVIVSRKVGAPGDPELAIGAVMHDGTLFLNEVAPLFHGIEAYLDEERARQRSEAERRLRLYRGDRPYPVLARRTVVVVDDGAATGATATAALRWLKAKGVKKTVVALPIAPLETIQKLKSEADAVVCPYAPEPFHAVGEFYETFDQVEDEQVSSLLKEAWERPERRNS